jgi:spermidine/putrescine transport system substrate-binding protein
MGRGEYRTVVETRRRTSRRRLLVGAATVGAALAAPVPGCITNAGAQDPSAATDLEKGPLVIYCWAEYISPENVKAFSDQFGVDVDYQVFDDNQAMYAKLAAGGAGYDVTVPTQVQVPLMSGEGLLTKLDHGLLPNLTNIDPRYLGQSGDPQNDYALPKNWGTDTIIWRTDLLDRRPASWKDFVDLAKGPASGRVTVMDSLDDIMWLSLKATGHSVNATDDAAYADAKSWLLDLKPHLLGIVPFGAERALLVSGQAILVMSGLNTAPPLRAEDPPVPVDYVFPAEGFAYFVDVWAIPATSKRPKLAHAWINFIHGAEAAAREAAFTYYGTVNKAAIDGGLIAPDVLKSIQPPAEVMQRLELNADIPAEVRAKRDELWTVFKSA